MSLNEVKDFKKVHETKEAFIAFVNLVSIMEKYDFCATSDNLEELLLTVKIAERVPIAAGLKLKVKGMFEDGATEVGKTAGATNVKSDALGPVIVIEEIDNVLTVPRFSIVKFNIICLMNSFN